jgi:hypothetical protein
MLLEFLELFFNGEIKVMWHEVIST